MLLIWGFKTTTHLLGIITTVCNRCGNPAAHRVEKLVRKFTLFWIPLFPTKTTHVITCAFCGVALEVPREQVPSLVAEVNQGAQPAPQQPPYQGQPYR